VDRVDDFVGVEGRAFAREHVFGRRDLLQR
jgi:hypothetical protein